MELEVRVWTIQRVEWLEALQRRGYITGDGRRVWRIFRAPYAWMMGQMARRMPAYNGRFPIWVWHSPKPDLRRGAHLAKGVEGVRVELSLPRERVLLLDFETWHAVLNGWHLSLSDAESEAWDRRVARLKSLPPDLRGELEATWERVFDFAALRESGLWGPIDRIQGVTDRVEANQVRRVDRFVSR
ncbi:MAG: DUF3841 domain-containing protein [Bryobacteraceae bacterium]|nr:DUF3841 domain-containing protein [Bryobacteraceae bacterium]